MKRFKTMNKFPLIVAILVVASFLLAGKMLEDTPMFQPNPFKNLPSPPTPVSMTVQKLDKSMDGGNVLFTATYTAEQVGETKEFSVFVNAPNTTVKKQVVLHDDGLNGDEKAGDLVFTATLNENLKLFKAAMSKAERRLQKAGGKLISFTGRAATVSHKDRLFDMAAFERFEKVAIDRSIFDIPFNNGPKTKKSGARDANEESMDGSAAFSNETPLDMNEEVGADEGGGGGGIVGAIEDIDELCDPFVDRFKSLFITDISVTEDPVRTFNPCTAVGNPNGAWTFKTLMANMANQPVTGVGVDIFTQEWLDTWMQGTPRLTPGTVNPIVNTQTLDSRVHPFTPVTTQASSILHTVIKPWLRAAAGNPALVIDSLTTSSNYWRHLWDKLSANGVDVMKFAPFKLTAIVNRVDLSTITGGGGGYGGTASKVTNGGEGRFVYSIIKNPANNCGTAVSSLTNSAFIGFNIIFEYGVPISDCETLVKYQSQWRDLSDLAFGSTYNQSLEKVTDVFTRAGANPAASNKNGSALNQLRSNEFANSSLLSGGAPFWQLREFNIDDNTLLLANTTTKLEPMSKFNGTTLSPLNNSNTVADVATLASFVNTNAAAIEANNYTVPLTTPASGGGVTNFLAGRADVHSPSAAGTNHHWNGRPGASTFITSDSARFMFSLNTCSGCHGGETNTAFVHVRFTGFGHNITPTSFSAGLRDISSFITGLGADVVGTDNDADPNGLFFVTDVAGRPSGTPRVRGFNDLLRREMFLKNLLCNGCSGSGMVFEFTGTLATDRSAKTH